MARSGDAPEVLTVGGEPVEFTWRGRRFRIHSVLSRWREAGGWWNRASDGNYRPDDLAKSFWAVEAAPEGMLITFHVERDELSGQWQVRKAITKSAVQVEEDE